MIDIKQHEIRLGKGDVYIHQSVSGSRESPVAMLVLTNCVPQDVGRKDEASLTKADEDAVYIRFSTPQSIDLLIHALQGVKKAAFGKKKPLMDL